MQFKVSQVKPYLIINVSDTKETLKMDQNTFKWEMEG